MALQGIEVEGVIIKEYPAKEGVGKSSGNPWKSQEFVIQTRDNYPRTCVFHVFGADRLNNFNLHQGDTVHIWLDINAHPWQDRYFNDINCYQCEHIDPSAVTTPGQPAAAPSQLGAAPAAAPAPAAQAAPAQPATTAQPAAAQDGADDLPF